MTNLLDSLQSRLKSIEDSLSKLDQSFTPDDNDDWKTGFDLPCEVLQVTHIVVLQNIGKIPHFKINSKIYFNRKVLMDYVKANSYDVSILGL